jgi:hypothetical protein
LRHFAAEFCSTVEQTVEISLRDERENHHRLRDKIPCLLAWPAAKVDFAGTQPYNRIDTFSGVR